MRRRRVALAASTRCVVAARESWHNGSVASSMTLRQFFPTNQPQTLQIAVALLYWNAFLQVLSGLVGLHFGAGALLALLADVAGAYGVANARRWGYYVAIFAALLPFLLVLRAAIFGGSTYFGGGVLTLVFDIALVALLLHPMSRGYVKSWFS